GLDLGHAGRLPEVGTRKARRQGAVHRARERAGDGRLHDAGDSLMAERLAEAAVAETLRKLAVVFADFEQRLEVTPLIRRLTRGRFELADYHAFLITLRQQVKDGALWMSRAASNIG